ncbi:MAG: multiheme c-type cytochrome [Actinomycetota bacterium]
MPTRRWPALFGLASAAAITLGMLGGLSPAAAGSDPTTTPEPTPARMRQSGCPTCHGNPAIADPTASRPKPRPDLYIPADAVLKSVHGDLPCTTCHPSLTSVIHQNPAQDLAKARMSCAKCHSEQADLYSRSPHGSNTAIPTTWLLPEAGEHKAPHGKQGDETPKYRPSCVTCHGAHDVRPPGSRAFAVSVATRCAQCHVQRGESFFERNYHGKGVVLGRKDIAGCPDCHGSHLILSADDPASMVAPENRLETCRTCHPKARGNFGDIQIHLAGSPLPDDPKLATVMAAMTLLVVMTFAMFGAHTILDMRHAWREHQKAAALEDETHE